MKNKKPQPWLIIILLLFCIVSNGYSARIKDIANIEGVTGVQIIGYGLVTGLNNTGDNQLSTFTVQSVSNMLKRFGLTIPIVNPRIRNVAAVMVTATIPTFAKKGSKFDVQVSSVGDATTLQGGILLMSPMSFVDGTIIGMAQGAVSLGGGYDFQSLGSRVSRNMVTTGRVPSALILDRDIDGQFVKNQQIRILLRDPDFTTATRIATAINAVSGLSNAATPIDAGTIQVQLPAGQNQSQIMQTISQIETQNVISDPSARVVINERTGTIVIGGAVQLLPSVIAHGGLEISIQKQVTAPPQAAFTKQAPSAIEQAQISTNELVNMSQTLVVQGPTVQDMANALNLLKVSPRDLIAIFQALKESGSLQGDLIVQ